jgi:hypothetical protein
MKKLCLALLLGATLPALAQSPRKVKVKSKAPSASQNPAINKPSTQPVKVTPEQLRALSAPSDAAPADLSVQYADMVTADGLRKHLSVLASDEYEGRETGQKGQKMAAEYITARFREDGLAGPVASSANPYLQPFQLERSNWAPNGQTLQVGGKTYTWLTDFYARGNPPFQELTTVQPVFVGYGIEQEGYSDYTKAGDVRGKDLLMLSGEPMGADGKPVLSTDGKTTRWGQANPSAKLEQAVRKGARSVFFVDFSPNANFAKLAARLGPSITAPGVRFTDQPVRYAPGLYVSPAVGYALLKTNEATVQKYMTAVAAAKQPVPSPFKVASFKVKTEKKREPFGTENVLGYMEGTDKKAEVLVISAHYDHLGIQNGEVYNGADDDGSGTSSILMLAEAFSKAKQEGHAPRRSILFLANVGEEKGLLGSQYYTNHPVFPLENTIADLNVDMVGRTDPEHEGKADYVYVIGADKLSSELNAINEQMNQKYTQLNLDYRYNDPADPNRYYYRSDHYNFATHKVPVAFYFNGEHADYHQASDEISKIEFSKMEKRARLVFHTAWELANREGRIVVDSNKP